MFYNSNATNESASVRVRTFKDSSVTTWDVVLYGIPYTTQGKEVTANWISLDINNDNTFYTDSSALEMQKRVFDYRPTWDLYTEEHVSGNYYPVNSAIAIVEKTKALQMTVMNDRSQAGSVIKNGRIELLMNRRLYYDDSRGVNEPLNETDSYGNGITVPATYHLELIDRSASVSSQRFI